MATAIVKQAATTTIIIELNEVEAQYVWAALCATDPAYFGNGSDPVHDVLSDAMDEAGISSDLSAAISR